MNKTYALCIAAAIGILPASANADFIPIPLVSGPGWLSYSSYDMQSQAPYPHASFAPDPTTTRAQFMWSRNAPGQDERVSVNFSRHLPIPDELEPDGQYGAWIAADNAMVLYIPGTPGEDIFFYNLAQNTENGLPVPIFIDFTAAIQRKDKRYFDVWACDGGTAGRESPPLSGCHDDGDRWVFLDFEHGPDERPSFMAIDLPDPANLPGPGPTTPVPEPSSLSLLTLAALVGWRFRKGSSRLLARQ